MVCGVSDGVLAASQVREANADSSLSESGAVNATEKLSDAYSAKAMCFATLYVLVLNGLTANLFGIWACITASPALGLMTS
jgi:hypothetical protein